MLRQVYQVLVLPNSFRSIDFTRKGAYCLTFKLVYKNAQRSTFGYPFRLHTTESTLSFQPQVDQQNGTYQTQMFFISFNSQKFQFQTDGCLFRIEKQWMNEGCLEMEIKLLHFDVDSLNTETVRKNSFKEKASRNIKIQNIKDFYGDVIFGEFDYFCAVELTIQTVTLDYKFRLNEYQLSDFIKPQQKLSQNEKLSQKDKQRQTEMHHNIPKQQAKISNKQKTKSSQKQKRISKFSSVQEKQSFLISSLKSQTLIAFYKKLITRQLLNYQNLHRKLAKLLSYLCQTDVLSFWRQYRMIPRDLGYLEDDKGEITQEYIRSKYSQELQNIYSSILEESNLLGKNIRYVWIMNYQLESFLLKKRFSHFREEYEVNLFFDNRRKFFRDPATNREQQIVKFKTEVKRQNHLKYPLIFSELFDFPKKKKQNSLVIMMHGFQGSDYDMDLVKNYLMTYNRNVFCYVCHTLQGNNSDSIQVLGEKFAKQTMNIMLKLGTEFTNVSFIGYSLGGIIIRAGLKHLEVIKDKINVFLSLASPHLGISKLDNFLVKTGVWYMSKFENYPSMKSLAQIDDYMEELSKQESLKWIRKFIVLGSKQDDFVPCYSAKIEETGIESIDILHKNIIQRVHNLKRIEVWFDSNPKIIDKLIGRKAHIEFLESKEFCEAFFSVYSRIF